MGPSSVSGWGTNPLRAEKHGQDIKRQSKTVSEPSISSSDSFKGLTWLSQAHPGWFLLIKSAGDTGSSPLWWRWVGWGQVGGRSKRVGIYVHVKLLHFTVQQELRQHCKAIICQLKNLKNKVKWLGALLYLQNPSAFVLCVPRSKSHSPSRSQV